MARRPLYYGWFDAAKSVFRVSRYPADAPVRPSIEFENKSEIDEMLRRKRADIMWWPPLPADRMTA